MSGERTLDRLHAGARPAVSATPTAAAFVFQPGSRRPGLFVERAQSQSRHARRCAACGASFAALNRSVMALIFPPSPLWPTLLDPRALEDRALSGRTAGACSPRLLR